MSEPSITTLARRLVAINANLALTQAVGDAFGHATGALLDEMRRVSGAKDAK